MLPLECEIETIFTSGAIANIGVIIIFAGCPMKTNEIIWASKEHRVARNIRHTSMIRFDLVFLTITIMTIYVIDFEERQRIYHSISENTHRLVRLSPHHAARTERTRKS
mmetsp:Transcript_4782/g.5530  ORF Transcript_4782/g.5530 Transcript_4782/m.5530 type:complete len:109 (-) Transcript_4782:52-378(-)